MLEQAKIDLTFVDIDTGEVIRKYQGSKCNENDEPLNICDFVNSKTLAPYVASFIRGCQKRRNISLQITFNLESIF